MPTDLQDPLEGKLGVHELYDLQQQFYRGNVTPKPVLKVYVLDLHRYLLPCMSFGSEHLGRQYISGDWKSVRGTNTMTQTMENNNKRILSNFLFWQCMSPQRNSNEKIVRKKKMVQIKNNNRESIKKFVNDI